MSPEQQLPDQSAEEQPKPKVKKVSEPEREVTFLGYLRDWADALVIAFVIAMFIRMFVVELFKIPTGSMSPTLLGDFIARGQATDREGEGHQYLLILGGMGDVQVFQKNDDDGYYTYQGRKARYALTSSQQFLLESGTHREEHRILVNKFAYWFKKPDRGDIIVFRVPFKTDPVSYTRNGVTIPGPKYSRDQAVYVKRAVALPGEEVRIGEDHHLYINDELLKNPEVMTKLQYIIPEMSDTYDIKVPEGHVVAMGDNSDNSLDSRYWGPLPLNNLRGRAVVRYWPMMDKWFLNHK